jgi:transposase-like protein
MLKRMPRIRRVRPVQPSRSAFTGFRFPREVIVLAVRWYLRYGLSYRDVEELLAERGVQVDHVSIYRWVRRFTPILAEAARCAQHAIGSRWQVDETYVKVAGCWRYVYRAVDEYGQVIDVYVSPRRDSGAARRFFHRALATAVVAPVEVVTDQAACYLRVLEEMLPKAWHRIERYATDEIVNREHSARWGLFLDPFLSSGGSGLRRWSGAEVKVERPAGRTTLTSARTGVASGGGGRGWTSSQRAG